MCTREGEKTVILPRFDGDTLYPASTMYKDRTTSVQCFLYFAEKDKNLTTLKGFLDECRTHRVQYSYSGLTENIFSFKILRREMK